MKQTPEARPGWRTGLLVGALVTAPLIALFFLADALVGLPLVPFDLMDWAARNLPGGLLTAGIDAMVAVITALDIGPTDQVAKPVEQAMFVIALFVGGVVAGAVFYEVIRRTDNARMALPLGAAFGAVALGVPLALISASTNFSALTPVGINILYIVAAFAGWGAALGWIYGDLVRLQDARASAATSGNAAIALDRRQFLVRLGGATATLTVVGAGLSTLLRSSAPSAETVSSASTAGAQTAAESVAATVPTSGLQPAPGTRPEYTPLDDHYRIDISSRPPRIDGATWTLPITGLVANPMTLTLDDLQNNYEPMDYIVTIGCISNPVAGDLVSTIKWTGVSMQQIIEQLDVQAGAGYLLIKSADGFFEYVSLDVIREDERVMLAWAWDDQPLTEEHGFPLRIWIPDRFGMKQPKWIESIEVVATDDEGYWVRRGWSAAAIIRATTVIDTVAVNDVFEQDGQQFVPMGGMAWAGARGVSRVEVQVDDGEWQEAQLRTPLSDVSWVIWRYDWPFAEGQHTFTARLVEGDGTTRQIEERAGVRPDGATGLHAVARSVQSA